jgi:hypothetical protein
MTYAPLKFLSDARLTELLRDVSINRERYSSGDFLDLERDNGWAIETSSVQVDSDALRSLDGTAKTAEADFANSVTVYEALKGMTPALAREERVWARLTHVECLTYSRARWLEGKNQEAFEPAVRRHIFAAGLTGVRDDNAVSRLWWNMHIATIADPSDPASALRLILKRADIRLNFVERTGSASRKPIAQAVIRAMRRDPWITSTESTFRQFMIELNRNGGGVLFEVMTEAQADAVLESYAESARLHAL